MHTDSPQPEASAPTEPEPTLFERLRAAPVTTLLFVVCIVVFILAEAKGSTERAETLIEFGATWRGGVWHGEGWRLFTSMFLHIGALHLVWNLWAGFSWSAPFEQRLGPLRFSLVYVVSGVVGSAVSIIGHDVVSAGASGALFGVIGGGLILAREHLGSWKALLADPMARRTLLLSVLWLAIGPFVGFDSFAHAGGMVAGMSLTWALCPLRKVPLALSLIAAAILTAASLQPIPGLHPVWVDRSALSDAWDARQWSEVVALTEGIADDDLKPFRAHALIEVGRGADAEALIPLEASGADNPRWLADLHRRVGHPERAVQVLMAASQRASNDIALEADLIFALEATGKPDQREQAHRMGDLLALKSPHSAEGLGFRARQLIRAGRLEAALEPMTLAARDRSDLFADELAALVDTLDRTRAD